MVNWVAWKTGLALVALFGLGMAAGVVIGQRSVSRQETPATSAEILTPAATNKPARTDNLTRRWGESRKASYLRAIRPTAEQAEALEKHFQVFTQEVARIQSNTRQELQQALRQLHRNIEAELTPAQRRAFAERLRKLEKPDKPEKPENAPGR
ncbi:hypothetical protein NXS98_11475 [Fontisphaera persica]|uniref:hypothetical protein n=1 Tax=Fontisphaera persica TaxID=2974023 RepID=UPI0024C0DC3A|nr:hypothetical protein [Fontisphaera persica]WCJ58342.1 hypothetical protein NXS98_11475 [Fontisphaera persica]